MPPTPARCRPGLAQITAALPANPPDIPPTSPHNPSGMVWTREEMLPLQVILAPTDVLLISDEVY